MDFLKNFGATRFAFVIGLTISVFIGLAYSMHWMGEPTKTLLFSNLDPRDSAEIAARLDAKKISYEVIGDGSTILVPSDQALKLRMEMAGDGLPAGGSVGYEIFDRSDTFGQTSFVQNVNLVRALEGELARTIRSIQSVANARVHLNIPKHELFAEKQPDPTASVVIKSRGQLTPAQVVAIQNLIASAVPGLASNSITVIDEKGTMLGGGSAQANGALAVQHDERNANFEDRVRAQIEDIITGIVGPGRARVQVSADIDYNRITKESQTYDPDGQVVRSTQTTSNASTSQDGKSSAGVTVTNSLPGGDAGAAGGATSSNDKRSEETINYEISRTVSTEVQEGGAIKKLSVAVAVDGTYKTDDKGTRTYQPRSAEELAQIEQLVKSAIGFDDKRGDQLKVVNLPFSQPEIEQLPPPEEPLLGLEKEDILHIAQFGGIGIIALLLIFFVMRPMIKALATPSNGGLLIAQASPGQGALAAAASGAMALASPGAAGMLPPPASAVQNMIDISQVEGQVKESSVRKVGEIVGKHPDETVAIVRQWLHGPD
jgi:flagellar M-ring protein FliF